MKSAQLNFFMMPEDIYEMEQYINKQELLMIAYSNKMNSPRILNSLNDMNEIIAYLVRPQNLSEIKLKYYQNQNKYIVNDSEASVIEYFKPIFKTDNKTMLAGRIYFEKIRYNDKGETILKDEATIYEAEKLFAWIKKHFKNAKINHLHTTQRVAEIVKRGELKLIINN